MNVDPRGFYVNEQGVVAPKQTVFNGGKRKTRKSKKVNRKRKANRKTTRRNRRNRH
jgi:hypothetical protein